MVLGGLWHGAAWTFVLWGAFHGAALVVRARARRPRRTAAGVAALAVDVQPRGVRLGAVPRRATSATAGRFLRQLLVAAARRRCATGSPWSRSWSRSSGMQLLPERAARRAARCGSRPAARLPLGVGLATRRPAGRRDRARPGRAAVHLLPVLMACAATSPPHPLEPPRTPPAPRARRDRRRADRRARCCSSSTGGSVRRAGEEMEPGLERDVVLAVGEPAGWLADRLPCPGRRRRATASLSPDEDLGRRRAASTRAPRRRRPARRRAGDAGRVRPGASSGAAPRSRGR